MNNGEFGLYIHIPFCERKCIYCDFLSFNAYKYGNDGIGRYFETLFKEIGSKKKLIEDKYITSIFIGGGTPSVVSPSYIYELMSFLYSSFKIDANAEVTIEVNPGTVAAETFKIYRKSNINRISFGVQSLDDDVLKFLRRIHTKDDFIKSLHYAREEGYSNINADLLMGVPNQSIKSFSESIMEAARLNLTHISCYSLILEEDTQLFRMIEQGEVNEPDENADREMYKLCKDYLTANGYNHYEISNFAKDGYQCRHNMLYWKCNEYLGFGLGASSFLLNERFKNTGSMNDYFSWDFSEFEIESLDIKDRMNEFMMLGFRLIKGPDPELFHSKFNRYYHIEFSDKLRSLKNRGLIRRSNISYCLTEKGLDLANQVFMEFV